MQLLCMWFFAGIIAAIMWNMLTWYLGILQVLHTPWSVALPALQLHMLVGGLFIQIKYWKLPLLSYCPYFRNDISYLLSIILLWVFKNMNPFRLERFFKWGQLLSSACFSLGHGGNDAQKVMGIISAALLVFFSGKHLGQVPHWAQITFTSTGNIHHIPLWVVLGCHAAIAFGTYREGGGLSKPWEVRSQNWLLFEGVACWRSRGHYVIWYRSLWYSCQHYSYHWPEPLWE